MTFDISFCALPFDLEVCKVCARNLDNYPKDEVAKQRDYISFTLPILENYICQLFEKINEY